MYSLIYSLVEHTLQKHPCFYLYLYTCYFCGTVHRMWDEKHRLKCWIYIRIQSCAKATLHLKICFITKKPALVRIFKSGLETFITKSLSQNIIQKMSKTKTLFDRHKKGFLQQQKNY